MSFACSTYSRPGSPEVTIGGTSRPVKECAGTAEWPTSTLMYAPETSVPRPEMFGSGDAGTDHPEAGVLHQIIARVAMNARLDDHVLAVLGDADLLDLADLHRLVADLGLVRLQIVGGVEGDLDGHAFGQFLVHGHERAGDDHDCGQDPHIGQAHAVSTIRQRLRAARRQAVVAAGQSRVSASHSSRSSNDCAASMVSTTTAANANAPGRTCTGGQGLNLHEARQQRQREHVEHRPAADELHDAEQPAALPGMAHAAAPDGEQDLAERDQLEQRHHDAREKNEQRDGPGSLMRERDDAAHDGVVFVAEDLMGAASRVASWPECTTPRR